MRDRRMNATVVKDFMLTATEFERLLIQYTERGDLIYREGVSMKLSKLSKSPAFK